MENIIVRAAKHEELDTLFEFEQGVIAAERPFDPTLRAGHINYYDLRAMLDDPQVEVIVAISGKEIVGSGYARIEDAKDYLKHQKHAYLGFMYVKPAFRGKGINQKIIQELHRWAASQGITEIRLDVYADNIPAIKAYEKVGFTRHLVNMRMDISNK